MDNDAIEARAFAITATVKAEPLSPAPQTGTVGCPASASSPAQAKDGSKTWIEVALRDGSGAPVPGEPFTVTLPDGSQRGGVLDGNGLARVDGIDPGSCQITFTRMDRRTWRRG